jgi:signal transduction histidine kinase
VSGVTDRVDVRGQLRGQAVSTRPLRAALAQLALAAGAIAGIEVALFAAGPAELRWLLWLFVAVGVEYVAAGLLAWVRRPSNGTGVLLCLCGFSVLVAAIGNTTPPALYVVGNLLAELPIAVLLHLLLAFPSGRLPDWRSRWLVLAGYLIAALHIPKFLFAGDPALPTILDPGAQPDLVLLSQRVQYIAGALVVALTVRVIVQRLRRADPQQRRGLAALYAYGTFTIVFLVVSANLLPPLLNLDPVQVFELQLVAFAGVPIAFVTGVLRGGFARTREIDELAAWLGSADSGRPGLRAALRATLGDSSLDLLFWLPELDQYVDEHGLPVPLPAAGSGRGAVDVQTATGRVGAIGYDATLLADPEPVRAAGRVVALAIERERLTVELRASREALRESRSRLVESGDRERRRIARDLHDGLQGRLVVLALRAGQLATRVGDQDGLGAEVGQLRSDLETAISELRRLVHGVLPALLLQRGLAATVEELLDQTPIRSRLDVAENDGRVPPHVETAGYFVVAEALANAVKHARAQQLSVTLTRTDSMLRIEVHDDGVGGADLDRGSGLRGICDRIEALGGRLDLDSTPGRGTRVLAELPCAS